MSRSIPSFEVKILLSALDDLLDMKVFFRKIAPYYSLDEESNEVFLSILNTLYQKIQPLFQKYLLLNISTKSMVQTNLEFLTHIKEIGSIVLVSASSSKTILKRLGLNPQNIIVSGGPLIYEDYKEINPSLPDQALLGIKKKCQNLVRILQSNRVKENELIFIYDPQNLTDKIILNELNKTLELIGKEVKPYKISSWKEIEKYSTL